MSESLIVVNAGSSSLKFNVYQLPQSASDDVDELAFCLVARCQVSVRIEHILW